MADELKEYKEVTPETMAFISSLLRHKNLKFIDEHRYGASSCMLNGSQEEIERYANVIGDLPGFTKPYVQNMGSDFCLYLFADGYKRLLGFVDRYPVEQALLKKSIESEVMKKIRRFFNRITEERIIVDLSDRRSFPDRRKFTLIEARGVGVNKALKMKEYQVAIEKYLGHPLMAENLPDGYHIFINDHDYSVLEKLCDPDLRCKARLKAYHDAEDISPYMVDVETIAKLRGLLLHRVSRLGIMEEDKIVDDVILKLMRFLPQEGRCSAQLARAVIAIALEYGIQQKELSALNDKISKSTKPSTLPWIKFNERTIEEIINDGDEEGFVEKLKEKEFSIIVDKEFIGKAADRLFRALQAETFQARTLETVKQNQKYLNDLLKQMKCPYFQEEDLKKCMPFKTEESFWGRYSSDSNKATVLARMLESFLKHLRHEEEYNSLCGKLSQRTVGVIKRHVDQLYGIAIQEEGVQDILRLQGQPLPEEAAQLQSWQSQKDATILLLRRLTAVHGDSVLLCLRFFITQCVDPRLLTRILDQITMEYEANPKLIRLSEIVREEEEMAKVMSQLTGEMSEFFNTRASALCIEKSKIINELKQCVRGYGRELALMIEGQYPYLKSMISSEMPELFPQEMGAPSAPPPQSEAEWQHDLLLTSQDSLSSEESMSAEDLLESKGAPSPDRRSAVSQSQADMLEQPPPAYVPPPEKKGVVTKMPPDRGSSESESVFGWFSGRGWGAFFKGATGAATNGKQSEPPPIKRPTQTGQKPVVLGGY